MIVGDMPVLRWAAICVIAAASAAHAQPPPGFADPGLSLLGPTTTSTIKLSHDRADRMTVPVMIGGHGPFAFVVDTGADRTVISTELAAQLRLEPGPLVLVRSTADERTEQTALIPSMTMGGVTLRDERAPMLGRAAIGADGMLGVDALRDQAMVMDFARGQMHLHPSAPIPVDPGSIIVNGRNRYGQLILLDAHVRGATVYVILDSGAETSIVNSTFRRRMEDGLPAGAGRNPALLMSVTGGANEGQYGSLSELTLGDMTLRDMPVVFSDIYTFRLFHLEHRPAMLLGMDALRVFSRVEVDYPKRLVSFRLRRQ